MKGAARECVSQRQSRKGERNFLSTPLALGFPFACSSFVTAHHSPKWRACSQAWLVIDLHRIQTKSNLVVLYLCAPWSSPPSFLLPLFLPLFFLHFPPKPTEQQVIRTMSYKLKSSRLFDNHKGNGNLFVKSTITSVKGQKREWSHLY